MLLINSSPKDALKIFQPFLPIYVPVGIGYLAAMAERERIPFEIIDEQIEHDVMGKVAAYAARHEKPYMFCCSVLTAALKSAIELSKQLKAKYPGSVVIFGSIHPTAQPDEILAFDHIDLAVRGDGEYILPKLYRRIKAHKEWHDIEGVSFRLDGKAVHNPCPEIISNLDNLPPFPYHPFADKKGYDLGFIMSSRDCPYECIFCCRHSRAQALHPATDKNGGTIR